ncbi:MAG: nucleotide sugar dehydrogenase [Pseudomonadota bacterium]
MRISIFGLGYVGAISAGCLAERGHSVVGVDVNPIKVAFIERGASPVIEAKIGDMIACAVQAGKLRSTTDGAAAVAVTDLAFVCVGTPSQTNGNLDLTYVRAVCEEIGAALKNRKDFFVVVMRSTVLPGTTAETVIPLLERHSGKRAGIDFGVCFNPEFLREGSAVDDFFNPPKTVIGATDERSRRAVESLYEGLDAPLINTDIAIAEMVKYADNAWHALKVGFGNEIGALCKALGVDGHKVMDIFCRDTKLNISAKYLKPGFAFGGSCLPKDLRALTYRARRLDLDLPILGSILPSNERHLNSGFRMIAERANRKVGILGLSFKAGTDDLRESPMVGVVEQLIGKGYDVRIFDPNVKLAGLMGSNKNYLLNHIPHIYNLVVDSIDAIVAHADTVVIGNDDPTHREVLGKLKSGQVVVDFARISNQTSDGERYHGICW